MKPGICAVGSCCTGPMYRYLGHFANPKFLAAGHNTVSTFTGKQDDASDMNSFVEQNAAQNAPGAKSTYTATSLTGNPL
jgi:hypothetical protein